MVLPALAATLIMALPSSDGLVVCADRRAGSPTLGVVDSYRKLFPAGDKAVFSVTGQTEARTPQGVTLFDVRKAVTEGIRKYGFPSLNDLQSFAQRAVLDPLTASGTLNMLAPPETPGSWVVQISFFYYLGKDPIEADIQVFYQKGVDAVPRAQVTAVRFDAPDSFSLHGTTIVPKEMISGHDPRLNDMRKSYSTFRQKQRSAAEVMSFERWVIRESSRRTHELTDVKKRNIWIGPTADCAEVSPTGVRWDLHEDKHVPERHRVRSSAQ